MSEATEETVEPVASSGAWSVIVALVVTLALFAYVWVVLL